MIHNLIYKIAEGLYEITQRYKIHFSVGSNFLLFCFGLQFVYLFIFYFVLRCVMFIVIPVLL